MCRMLWVPAAALLVLPVAAWSRQDQQQSGSQQSQSQQAQQSTSASQSQNSQSQSQPQSAAPQKDSLADAARKAREQKKETPKPAAKVFTNDNIPTSGGISAVGEEKEPGTAQAATGGAQAATDTNGENFWRSKFAQLRHKLDQDQGALDVMQRELGVAEVQYYGGDPNKAMNDATSQQPFGSGYTKKLGDIDAKKKQVDADKQAISDAEDDLRKAGGDPGWAR